MNEDENGRPYLKYLLHAVILGGVILAAVKYLNGEEVLAALRSYDVVFVPFLLLTSLSYLLLKAWRFVLLMRSVSDVPSAVVFKGYVAGQAATLVPGGVAARAGLMHQVGVPVARSTAPIVMSSVLDQAVFITSSVGAAFWVEEARLPAIVISAVLLVIGIIAAVPASRNWVERSAAWIARKVGVQEDWECFLETVPDVLTRAVILPTFAITLVAFALKVIALDLTMRGLGLELPYPALFLVYILPTLLGRIFPLPGGVGVTEASMVGFLTGLTQIDVDTAAAGVAIFRVATVVFEAFVGALVYYLAWRGEKEIAGRAAGDRPQQIRSR